MPEDTVPITVYKPIDGWRLINTKELWRFRELLYYFTWRDVKVRYKQTALGATWALLQPFMMMVVFSIFFGRMAGINTGDLPYPIFVYSGLVLWTFFANAVSTAGNSVVGASSIVTKVYFPRLIIPFASIGAAALDFCIACVLLMGMMIYFGVSFSWTCLLLPLPFIVTAMAALGVGTLLAALNVSFRDFRYTIPFLVQLWLFATPTVYMEWNEVDSAVSSEPAAISEVVAVAPGEVVPLSAAQSESAVTASSDAAVELPNSDQSSEAQGQDGLPAFLRKAMFYGNPVTGLVAFFRSAALGSPLPWFRLGVSSLLVTALFICGLAYFRRVESSFADII